MQELSPYVEFHPAIASILLPFPGTEIYENYKNEYHLENWWLREDKTQSSTTNFKRPYFDTKLFTTGNMLDFDFFHYSDEMKQKIQDLFMFMYTHNGKKYPLPLRYLLITFVNLSQKLYANSPNIEYFFFMPLKNCEQYIRNRIS
ncbi:Uncharacterised protein [uncultured archaeon]|nr:Uncharacterised protein [uncultured archaeon]